MPVSAKLAGTTSKKTDLQAVSENMKSVDIAIYTVGILLLIVGFAISIYLVHEFFKRKKRKKNWTDSWLDEPKIESPPSEVPVPEAPVSRISGSESPILESLGSDNAPVGFGLNRRRRTRNSEDRFSPRFDSDDMIDP